VDIVKSIPKMDSEECAMARIPGDVSYLETFASRCKSNLGSYRLPSLSI